jgi:hypothetical protein
LHCVVLFVEMAVVSRLISKFNSYYADRPGMPVYVNEACGLDPYTNGKATGSFDDDGHERCRSIPHRHEFSY